jgi:hypothetical protein
MTLSERLVREAAIRCATGGLTSLPEGTPEPKVLCLTHAAAAVRAALDEAAKVARDKKLAGRSPIGPLHGMGWNSAAESIASAIAAL